MVQGHSQLHSNSEVSLGFRRFSQTNKIPKSQVWAPFALPWSQRQTKRYLMEGGCSGYVCRHSFNSLKGLSVSRRAGCPDQSLGLSSDVQRHKLGLEVHICHPRWGSGAQGQSGQPDTLAQKDTLLRLEGRLSG